MPIIAAILVLFGCLVANACAQSPQNPADSAERAQKPTKIVCEWHADLAKSKGLMKACQNHRQRPMVITKVQCETPKGSLIFHPRLNGGNATSILAAPLLCVSAANKGVLNGQPRVANYVDDTTECRGHCSVDFLFDEVKDAEEAILVIVMEEAS